MITLSRPELHERRPDWGAGQRNFTSIYLEPLSESSMTELLAGLVPGLPDGLLAQILARAEGVPLYAVETVRMLLDRGALERSGDLYLPTGELETLEVPETLQALIAARLDGLSDTDRRLLQVAAVLGKTFTRASLASLSGSPGARARTAARRARAERGALAARRRPGARARPVRLPPGPRSPGRVRHAGQAAAQAAASRGRRFPELRREPRTNWPR